MAKKIKINQITINGVINRIGDVEVNNVAVPRIVLIDNYGKEIILDVSMEDVLSVKEHLYEEVSMTFDAVISITNK